MRHRLFLITVILAAVVCAVGARQSSSPPPTGMIMGRVIDPGTEKPVASALVRLAAPEPGAAEVAVLTDTDGQFVFGSLPASCFQLMVSKPGFASASYMDGRCITVRANERIGNARRSLWKFGTITGRVTDETGEPVIGVVIRAFRRSFAAGHVQLIADELAETDDRGIYRLTHLAPGTFVVAVLITQSSAPSSVVELFQTPEGRELRSALGGAEIPTSLPGASAAVRVGSSVVELTRPMLAPTGDPPAIYQTLFYPGGTIPTSESFIEIGSGTERSGVDFSLKPVRAQSIAGTVRGVDGPAAHVGLSLIPVASRALFRMEHEAAIATTVSDHAGRFAFPLVPRGDYVVRAVKGPGGLMSFEAIMVETTAGGAAVTMETGPPTPVTKPESPTTYLDTPVSVGDTRVEDLIIPIKRGARISGVLRFEGSATKPTDDALDKLILVLESADGRRWNWDFETTAGVDAQGRFESVELPPGKYFIRNNRDLGPWMQDAVLVANRDVSDTPFVVTDKPIADVVVRFSDRPASLNGTVRRASNNIRESRLSVVVFPTDRGAWIDFGDEPPRLKRLLVDPNGGYSAVGLPPGEYFVAAEAAGVAAAFDPAALEQLSHTATRVTIAAGEKRTLDLVIR